MVVDKRSSDSATIVAAAAKAAEAAAVSAAASAASIADLRARIDAQAVKIDGLNQLAAGQGPAVDTLSSEVLHLRERVHDISNKITPFALIYPGLALIPTRVDRIEERLLALTMLPEKFDSFKIEFFTFKGKIVGALVFAAIFASILTGIITGLVMKAMK